MYFAGAVRPMAQSAMLFRLKIRKKSNLRLFNLNKLNMKVQLCPEHIYESRM